MKSAVRNHAAWDRDTCEYADVSELFDFICRIILYCYKFCSPYICVCIFVYFYIYLFVGGFDGIFMITSLKMNVVYVVGYVEKCNQCI